MSFSKNILMLTVALLVAVALGTTGSVRGEGYAVGEDGYQSRIVGSWDSAEDFNNRWLTVEGIPCSPFTPGFHVDNPRISQMSYGHGVWKFKVPEGVSSFHVYCREG